MANNITVTQGSGTTMATTESGAVHHPKQVLELDNAGTPVVVSNSNPVPVSDAGGSITVDGTVAVSSSALPTGASTAALQTTGNTSLATLAGAVSGTEVQVDVLTMPSVTVGSSALPTGAATSANQTTEIGHLATLAGAVSGTEVQVDVLSSALPTGASTEATLAAASAKLPATLGQKTMANSMAVVVASDQSAVPVSGTVAVTGVATAANQTTEIGHLATIAGAVSGTEMQVDVVAALPAGNNNIGDVDAIQSGTWNITNVSGTVSLPTGASTAAHQVTAQTSLSAIQTSVAAIDTGTPAALGQTTMSASMPVVVASDQTAMKVKPDSVEASGTASAINTNIIGQTDVSGYQGIAIQITGTFSASVSVQYSNDATTWHTALVKYYPTNNFTALIDVVQSPGLITSATNGFRYFRLRVVSYSSGTVGATVRYSTLPQDMIFNDLASGADSSAQYSQLVIISGLLENGVVTLGVSSKGRLISAASTNLTDMTGGNLITLKSLHIYNSNAAVRYVKLYENSSVTVGTTTPTYTIPCKAQDTTIFDIGTGGIRFDSDILHLATTTGLADSDTGAVGANDLIINWSYSTIAI